ncbi:MAG: flagellar FliJ family protein [Burkholderiales bacterium]|nr:flagellar FliJ family protein [Burkholderiales bacterium]
MKARQCWSIMAGKAERRLAQIQADTGRANQLLETLEASQQRLEFLYEEYRLQGANAAQLSHGMQDAMNQRQFMAQLATLSQRVAQDIEKAKAALASLRQQQAGAEIERLKMQTLDEKEVLAFEGRMRRREQRSMDELGVSQFNRIGLA